jgi:hypothetical protein
MYCAGATEDAANVFQKLFSALLLLCLAVSGCGYSCYSGFWNPNGSGVAVSSSSCPLTKSTGAVSVELSTTSASPAASTAFPSTRASSHDIQHIFVTLRGIEAHPSGKEDEESPGWQELAPDLAAHPMQLDLLSVDDNSRSSSSAASANVPATVPADEYRQIRLRLVPLDPSPDDLIPESNACGNIGWNCIVLANNSVRPLEFNGAAAEFRITRQLGDDTVLRVLPGQIMNLSIEFDAASSVFFVSSTAVRLIPVFRVVPRPPLSATSAE